ncbi:hypothetical protein AAMO2058_001201800 [Amorphochlora amoebiformis]
MELNSKKLAGLIAASLTKESGFESKYLHIRRVSQEQDLRYPQQTTAIKSRSLIQDDDGHRRQHNRYKRINTWLWPYWCSLTPGAAVLCDTHYEEMN